MDEKNVTSVPYAVFEREQVRNERTTKRLIIALIIVTVLLAFSNALWLCEWSQYYYTSTETTSTTSTQYSQDGQGTNVIGDGNNVANTDGN